MRRPPEANPLITVGLTTFNRAKMVGRAIDSVLGQTHDNLELIVIDDCSSDDTGSAIRTYSDARIRYIRNPHNQGAVFGRNRALSLAKGQYIAFIDDDDIWEFEKLDLQVRLAEEAPQNCVVFSCGATVVTAAGKTFSKLEPLIRGSVRNTVAKGALMSIPSSLFFRVSALRAIGGYDTALQSHNEHDIWMQMARRNYDADYVDRPLVRVTRHLGRRMTSDVELRRRATEEYFGKWRAPLSEWMGDVQAKVYEREYVVKVMSDVAREAIARREVRSAVAAIRFGLRAGEKLSMRAIAFLWRVAGGSIWDLMRTLRAR